MTMLKYAKAENAAMKPNPKPMDLDRFFEVTSKRYPRIIARLAE